MLLTVCIILIFIGIDDNSLNFVFGDSKECTVTTKQQSLCRTFSYQTIHVLSYLSVIRRVFGASVSKMNFFCKFGSMNGFVKTITPAKIFTAKTYKAIFKLDILHQADCIHEPVFISPLLPVN